jgi:hypothetical protein
MLAPLCPIIRDQSRPAQPRYNVATSPHGLAPRQALVSVKRVLQRLAKPIDLADSLLPDDELVSYALHVLSAAACPVSCKRIPALNAIRYRSAQTKAVEKLGILLRGSDRRIHQTCK